MILHLLFNGISAIISQFVIMFIPLQTEEIVRLNGIYKRLLSNVKLFEGEGRVIGPNEVEVIQLDGTKISYSAKNILIATGSRAQRIAIPGQVRCFSSLLVAL